MRHIIGLGVAGNFTGHLEQAGEAYDFRKIKTHDRWAPKGIFPWYAAVDGFLSTWPVAEHIQHPGEGFQIQTEPEVALICEVQWWATGEVKALVPKQMMAWNDCSIREPAAPKISLKKNWGEGSKGGARARIDLDGLDYGGVADRYRLASFVNTDGALVELGEDSELSAYSYFHHTLIDWLIDRMNHQDDEGPLEDMNALLEAAGRPTEAWVAIGATRYTEAGAKSRLSVGDQSVVVLYDGQRYSHADIVARVEAGQDEGEGLSLLRQSVV